jgi:hypothetical protein
VDNGTTGDGPVSLQTDSTVAESVSIVSSPFGAGTFIARSWSQALATGSFVKKSGNVGNVTLNSFLANSTLARGTQVGLFIGKYVYVYSPYGMQIFVYYPTLENVAMLGPH